MGPFVKEVEDLMKSFSESPTDIGGLIQESLCVKEAEELVLNFLISYNYAIIIIRIMLRKPVHYVYILKIKLSKKWKK